MKHHKNISVTMINDCIRDILKLEGYVVYRTYTDTRKKGRRVKVYTDKDINDSTLEIIRTYLNDLGLVTHKVSGYFNTSPCCGARQENGVVIHIQN